MGGHGAVVGHRQRPCFCPEGVLTLLAACLGIHTQDHRYPGSAEVPLQHRFGPCRGEPLCMPTASVHVLFTFCDGVSGTVGFFHVSYEALP